MKRTTIIETKQADAILTGDWHLRLDTPTCRTDDFEDTQWRKVEWVRDLQLIHKCPVLHSGDLFHHWRPSPYLLSKTLEYLPDQFHTVYGNHDLPQHNIEEAVKSGIHTLERAGRLTVLDGTHWGDKPVGRSFYFVNSDRLGLVWHVFTYQMKKPWPGIQGPKAGGILRKYPEYDIILTGDNHQAFVEEHQGRILVNPGSLMRQTADQINFKPRVYLYYAEENRVEAVYIPISESAVTRDHLKRSQERDDRIEAFVEKIDSDWIANMSFEDNLEEFFQVNEVDPETKKLVYKAIEQ